MEGLFANTEQLKGKIKQKVESSQEIGLLSKKLATIITDVPIEFNEKEMEITAINQEKIQELFTELEFKNLLNTRLNKTEAKKLFATYRFGCVDHGRDLIHEKCIKYEVPSPIRVSMHMRAYTSWLSGDIPIQNTGKTKKLSDFNMRKCRLKYPIDYRSRLFPDTGKKKKYSYNRYTKAF